MVGSSRVCVWFCFEELIYQKDMVIVNHFKRHAAKFID